MNDLLNMEKAEARIDVNKLSQLAEKKEEELREVKSLQLSVLQKELQEKDKFLKLERARFQCLKRDFEFNLNIIEQRDTELLRYEKIFEELKENESFKNSDMSDMKIAIEELKSKLDQSEKEKIELERYYGKRTNELKTQMSHSLAEKNKEIQQEKDEYLTFKRNAERRIHESENEMEAQKRQLMLEFDEQIARKEKEFRSQLDEMDTNIHSKEITIKMMKKEVELFREGSIKAVEEKGELSDHVSALKKEISKRDWEIKDIENMAEIRVTELKQKLEMAEKEKHDLKTEFDRVYLNLDKTVKAKEQQMRALQHDTEEREDSLKSLIEKLKNEVVKAEDKLKQSLWDFNDRLKERDLKINGLEAVIREIENKAKIEHASLTQAIIARDLELEGLKTANQDSVNNINKLKLNLKQQKNDYDRLKEHEVLVIQSKEDLELHWQKKYEEASQNAEAKYQNFIAGLQQKLSTYQEELESVQNELKQRENLIKVLTRDKDVAYSLLKKHGIELKGVLNSCNELVPKEDLDSFAQQNVQLKNLVSMMRKEIESIEDRHRKEISQASVLYANDLEGQIQQLKTEKRTLDNLVHDLQEQVYEAKKQKKVTFFNDILTKETGEPKHSLQLKLKSAAMQIQGLVLERDRLQSIGNKLRNELAELKRQLHDKETTHGKTDPNTKNEIRHKVDLKNLENYYYQLAMEEFKEKPRLTGEEIEIELASSSENSVVAIQADHNGKINEFMEQSPVKESGSGKFTESFKDRKSSTPTDKDGLENQMNDRLRTNITSSSELSSLQDLWKILDEAESLASQTPRTSSVLKGSTIYKPVATKEEEQIEAGSHAFTQIEGHQMALKKKGGSKEVKLSKLAQGKYVPVKKALKIRNYNVKDDQ